MDEFAQFWGLVAKTFADRDVVLGYELMNEPWCGDIYEDPSLLIPGIADRKHLEPMYDQSEASIARNFTITLNLLGMTEWRKRSDNMMMTT